MHVFKKIFWIVLSAFLLVISIAKAQDATNPLTNSPPPTTTPQQPVGINQCNNADSCLRAIMTNTYETLQIVNTFPSFLQSFLQYFINLTKSDETLTPILQPNFAALDNSILQSNSVDSVNGQQAAMNLINNQPMDYKTFTAGDFSGERPAVYQVVPNINDITYATVLGKPPVKARENEVVPPDNYLKNIAGINIKHVIPKGNWIGKREDKEKYRNYFNTVMAIQSFNDITAAKQFANTATFTAAQTQLISQVSNADQWFLQVATEEIGKVIRQILLFESQNFVLLTQLIQVEKQILAAQMMSNTLTILNGQMVEGLMVSKAQGVRPQG